jgi:hypothetical protein
MNWAPCETAFRFDTVLTFCEPVDAVEAWTICVPVFIFTFHSAVLATMDFKMLSADQPIRHEKEV